jgi:hypothetical protein
MNIEISHLNDNRRITVNYNLYINELVKRMINTYDLLIYDIAGIYFYQNTNIIYLDSSNDTSLDCLFSDFNYIYNTFQFYILTIEQNNNIINGRLNNIITQFQTNYINRNNPQGINYINPTTYIYNNYYNNNRQNQPQNNDLSQNQARSQSRSHQHRNQSRSHQSRNQEPNQAPNQAPNNPLQNSTNLLYEIIIDTNNINRTNSVANGVANNTNNIWDNYLNSLWGNIFNTSTTRTINTSSIINNLPRGTFQELRNQNLILEECLSCGISLEEFQDNSNVISLPCKHAFMENEIRRWLTADINISCPTCREPVNNTQPQNQNKT